MSDDTSNGLGSNSIAARPAAIRDALREFDQMDEERKTLSGQHKARKKLRLGELGISSTDFDIMRKLDKREGAAPGATTSLFRDAYAALELGQQSDWLDAIGEGSRHTPGYRAYDGVTQPDEEIGVEIPPPARRRGRPPGSRNRPRA